METFFECFWYRLHLLIRLFTPCPAKNHKVVCYFSTERAAGAFKTYLKNSKIAKNVEYVYGGEKK